MGLIDDQEDGFTGLFFGVEEGLLDLVVDGAFDIFAGLFFLATFLLADSPNVCQGNTNSSTMVIKRQPLFIITGRFPYLNV